MSQENVELVRRLYQAFNEGTMDLNDWHTDAELRPALVGGGLVEGAVYRGHEGVAMTWNVFEVRDGKVANWRVFTERQEALKAVGND